MPTDAACSLPLGSCCMGIPIKLHYTFLLLLVAQIFFAVRQYENFSYTLLIFVLYGPVLLVSIVLHELGHAWMNKRFGGEADRIVLWPLGGYVVLGRTEGLSIAEDFWVALAGPISHIPQMAIWFGISCIFEPIDEYQFDADPSWDFDELKKPDGFVAMLAEQAVLLNAGLLIFNLFIPAYPLDGGRILAALLVSCCCCSVRAAALTTSVVALVLAAAMAAWAIYDLFIDNDDNDNADGGAPIILLLIAIWIGMDAFNLLRYGWQDKATEHALFNKECYRRRAGVAEPSDNSQQFGGGASGAVGAGETDKDTALSRRERRQQERAAKQEVKRQAKESKRQQGQEQQSTDAEEPSGAPNGLPPLEIPPEPDDPMLSPAGAGTSWTTFNTVQVQPPPPMMEEDKPKQRSGWFGRSKRPSQSANADDFVV